MEEMEEREVCKRNKERRKGGKEKEGRKEQVKET